jgi:hypothetical protein
LSLKNRGVVPLQFEFTLRNDWPPLAWIAECVPNDPIVRVTHGSQIELEEQWYCEAIWDGEFAGIDGYQRHLPTQSGRLELFYFRNLI